jgi:predicted amidophosphoribosyltransferase
MLFSAACVGCGRLGDDLCAGCVGLLDPLGAIPPPAGIDRCEALFAYEGVGRQAVVALKFRHRRSLGHRLAGALAARVGDAGVDAVTWVPTSARRRRQRGYDQARLLARGAADELAAPLVPCLARRGGAQTGRARVERLDGPRFDAVGRVPPRVVLVDDVLTTGASLRIAAASLRGAGARSVTALVVARTPRGAA